MAGSSQEVIIVPRNFVLLHELENAEKGKTDMSISYGLVDGGDITLTKWQCTILGEGCERIFACEITCGPEYPDKPPTVQMQSKVNYPFVVRARPTCPQVLLLLRPTIRPREACEARRRHFRASCLRPTDSQPEPLCVLQEATGKVNLAKCESALLKHWTRKQADGKGLEKTLVALKNEMLAPKHRKLPQPPDGETCAPPRSNATSAELRTHRQIVCSDRILTD